jgi:hypothetical protein
MKVLELFLLLLLFSISLEFKNNGIIRKLQTDESSDSEIYSEESSLSDDYQSSDENESNNSEIDSDSKNQTSPVITDPVQPPNYPPPLIILTGYGLFQRRITIVVFVVYFKRISGYNVLSRRLTFHVNIFYFRSLRLLQEEVLAECTRFTGDEDDNLQYNCTIPCDPNKNFSAVVSQNDFQFENQTNVTHQISSFANVTSKDISKQIAPFGNVVVLNNTFLEENGLKFTLTGNITDYLDSNEKEVVLSFDEDGKGNIKNVTCAIYSLRGNIYELDCMVEDGISATLNGVMGIISPNDKRLLIYMAEGEDTIINTGINHQSLYKRGNSSGGLSGGAIAAIVIATVVALIALAVIAMMCRKQGDVSGPFQESTLGINTNNISQ